MSNLILPPHVPQFTASQMLDAAHNHHLQANRDLLYDFASRGLVGKPKNGRWSAVHLNLWLNLLQLKQYKKAPIRFLYNVPISGWLFMGDVGGVEIEQVQLAMCHWVSRNRMASLETQRKSIQKIIVTAKTQRHSTHVRETKKELQEIFAKSGEHDWERVGTLLGNYIFGDTPQKRNSLGPKDAPLSADSIVTTWELREKMLLHYEQLDLSAYWQWECARAILASTLGPYMRLQSHYQQSVKGQHLQDFYAPVSLNNFTESACVEVLTLVALVRDTVEKNDYIPCLPDSLQPLAWQQGRYQGYMTSRIIQTASGMELEGNYTITPKQPTI